MYDIQMLGILDHNLTTVTVPLLNVDDTPMPRRPLTVDDRKAIRESFDQSIFGGVSDSAKVGSSPLDSAPASVTASYQSARLLAEKAKGSASSMSLSKPKGSDIVNSSRLSPIKAASEFDDINLGKKTTPGSPSPEPSSLSLRRSLRRSRSPTKMVQVVQTSAVANGLNKDSPSLLTDSRPGSPTTMARSISPVPPLPPTREHGDLPLPPGDSLPVSALIERNSSPARRSVRSNTTNREYSGSGASTPKGTPARSLRNQPSKGFIPSWVFNSFKPLLTASKPSFAVPAMENVARTDVATGDDNRPSSPSPSVGSLRGRPSKGGPNPKPIITPSTPSPSRGQKPPLKPVKSIQIQSQTQAQGTQPLPIVAPSASRLPSPSEEDALSRSLRNKGHGLSRSPEDSSLRAQSNALVQSSRHFTVNPCKPSAETIDRVRDAGGRRWRFVLPTLTQQHIVQWPSLIAPACLPLTTDFLPDQKQSDELYTTGTYTVQCYLEEGQFLIRSDAAEINLSLAMMREMVSQRLSRRFAYIIWMVC